MMIGTIGASAVVLLTIIFAGLLGIGVGGFACLVLRKRWKVGIAVTDAMIAAGISILVAFAVSRVDATRGAWASPLILMDILAVGGVLLRHFLQIRRPSTD
jgi:hypothetical protein